MLKKIVRRIVPKSGVRALEKSFRFSRGIFWQIRYGFPAHGARVVAVTGTNGKSTTCAFINQMLKEAGYKTAVYTTAFCEIVGKYEASGSTYTLEKQSDLQRFLARARKADTDWIVLEVTSHAIDQQRLMGLKVEVAAITNLTQDHLDYHGTMENYATVKARLLRDYGAQHAVLNADDKWYDFFAGKATAPVFSFGQKSAATARMSSLKVTSRGSSVILKTETVKLSLVTKMLGEFNLYNAAAAACVGLVLDLDKKAITKGITDTETVAGRMEPVDPPAGGRRDFTVLVDYAYTPDALENTLKTLQGIAKGKVRIVFGATGDRDRGKRPLMGAAVAKYADFIYLTDDETYTEDPDIIRDAVYTGIKQAGAAKKTKVILDRQQAIEKAIKEAKKGDVVLLAGIGHETSRNMGGQQISWNEKQIAKAAIKKK